MTTAPNHARQNYNHIADDHDTWDSEHRSVSRRRFSLVSKLNGKVLEIGIGTGLNLEYYVEGVDLTGLDRDLSALKQAGLKVKTIPENRVKLLLANAEKLPFLDGTFDTVVGTFVFRSFDHPERVAHEIKRVLRPGGKFYILDHHTREVVETLENLGWAIHSRKESACEPDGRLVGQIVALKPLFRHSGSVKIIRSR